MPNAATIIKAASSVLAASAALLTALKDNPQVAEGAKTALNKIRSATSSGRPKERFEAKLAAIEACADAVEVLHPESEEAALWRQIANTLRMRGELAWNSLEGGKRKAALKELSEETTTLLAEINARLTELTPGLRVQAAEKELTSEGRSAKEKKRR